jgi:predicted ribosome quality control (RQC) complex YloA/Tae2 family protein
MARIAGINIPPHKHTEIGLTAIFGIGRTRARKICEASGIAYSKKIKDLTDADLEKIRDQISLITIEGLASRNNHEHQAFDGHWLLPWFPPPPWLAHAWSAYSHQCTYSQGSA